MGRSSGENEQEETPEPRVNEHTISDFIALEDERNTYGILGFS
jgi:hypothetical protein